LTSVEDGAADYGLLAPVRAGSPVEDATGDNAYLQALLDAESALARAQAALGIAPAHAAAAIDAVARAELYDPRDLALRARAGGNPVIPLAADLAAAVPEEAAAFVHRGATSQDIMDTAAMLVARRARRIILDDLDRTAAALALLAAAHRATPMAGRTLTQHAVPVTFGLKAAGWRNLVLDGRDRLAAVVLPAQLGGAAGTLAGFAGGSRSGVGRAAAGLGAIGRRGAEDVLELAERFAAETGLAAPLMPWHVLRTPIADLAGALATTCGALGKLAADVLVLGRTEIGEVEETGGGGSSAMPHKANPVRATAIAAAARQAPALAAVLYGCMVAEDERPAGAWHAEWQSLRDLIRLAGGAAAQAAALSGALEARPGRMRANLDSTRGLIVSERLIGVLERLLGRRAARDLLARASREAAEQSVELGDVLAEASALTGLVDRKELIELLDPSEYLGAACALTDRALAREAKQVPET
jgi:3-carboxy-cis,cis-muconate cycloisomerase